MGNLELGSSSNFAICYINLGDLNMIDHPIYVDIDIIKLLCWAYDELESLWLEDQYAGKAVYEWIEECVIDMVEVKE